MSRWPIRKQTTRSCARSLGKSIRETFVDVFDFSEGNRLVTSIEVLSPVNKRPNTEGWNQYQRKRQALLQGNSANLVEIDLLRGEPHADDGASAGQSIYRFDGPYCERPGLQGSTRFFNKPVPEIAVPLLPPDSDVQIPLQPMIDAIYARSQYDRDIDYTKPITPPLTTEESLVIVAIESA